MQYAVIVNNYQLGAKVRTTPTHKIVSQERIDSKHTRIVYDVNEREKCFIEKVLARRLTVVQ